MYRCARTGARRGTVMLTLPVSASYNAKRFLGALPAKAHKAPSTFVKVAEGGGGPCQTDHKCGLELKWPGQSKRGETTNGGSSLTLGADVVVAEVLKWHRRRIDVPTICTSRHTLVPGQVAFQHLHCTPFCSPLLHCTPFCSHSLQSSPAAP